MGHSNIFGLLLSAALIVAPAANGEAEGLGVTALAQIGNDWPFRRDGGGTTFDGDFGVGYKNFQFSGTYRMTTPDLRQPAAIRAQDQISFSSLILGHLTWTSDALAFRSWGGGLYAGEIGNLDGQALQCWYHTQIGVSCPNWHSDLHPRQVLAGAEAWGRTRAIAPTPQTFIDAIFQGAVGNQTALARAGLLFGWLTSSGGRLPLPALREFTAPDLSTGTGVGLHIFAEGGVDPAVAFGDLSVTPNSVIAGAALVGQAKVGRIYLRATAQISQPYYKRPGKPEEDARLAALVNF